LPAVKTNFDRVAHQMTLADRLSRSMRNNRQRNIDASVERQAGKGAQSSSAEGLVALAAEFCLYRPIFSLACARY
jgi:hypothetical protein